MFLSTEGMVEQGWSVEESVKAGTTYLIVGPNITGAENPLETAMALRLSCEKALAQRYYDETKNYILMNKRPNNILFKTIEQWFLLRCVYFSHLG